MKKLIGLMVVGSFFTLAFGAGASQVSSASVASCNHNGLTTSGAALINSSGSTKNLTCSLPMDHAFSQIDTVSFASSAASGNCTLRDGNNTGFAPNSVAGGIHSWTTDRPVAGTGWAIVCTIPNGQSATWSQTFLF